MTIGLWGLNKKDKSHRIWNGGLPPDRLPQRFRAELTPLLRYGMVKLHTFHKRGAHIESLTAHEQRLNPSAIWQPSSKVAARRLLEMQGCEAADLGPG